MPEAQARSAIAQDANWERALADVLTEVAPLLSTVGRVDLALLFASGGYGEQLPRIVGATREATGARVLLGCTGAGVIGGSREIEGAPAIALLALVLPGAELSPTRIDHNTVERLTYPSDWHGHTGVGADAAAGWLVFADPFSLDPDLLVSRLSSAYPGLPLIGGLAAGGYGANHSFVFLNDEVYADGAVALALGGPYTLRTIVSQGAEPMSEPWTITDADGHQVRAIGQRPALDILLEALRALPVAERQRVQQNVLVGLAMDEYRDSFGRGDFLIRNLIGADPSSGVLVTGGQPKIGQTIQFQLRNARAADEELRTLLQCERASLGTQAPVAAVLCSCTGRGRGLFGEADHDARAVVEELGVEQVAGFFCNGEIGPVGGKNFVHAYTASIGLILQRPQS